MTRRYVNLDGFSGENMEQEEPTLNELDSRLAVLEAEVRHTDDGLKGFKAVIRASSLKAVLKVISTVDDEANLKISPDGISVLVADPANVSMIDIDLMRSAFLEFDATADLEIGIDVSAFSRILSVADDPEQVSLELSADEKSVIIEFGYVYELELLKDVRKLSISSIPALSLPVAVDILGHKFAELVKAAEVVNDHAHIGVDVGGVFFMDAKGDEQIKSVTLRSGHQMQETLSGSFAPSKKVVSIYSIDYLQGLAEAIPSAYSVMLRIGTDLPLLAEFMCCDGGRVKYMIAGRIDHD